MDWADERAGKWIEERGGLVVSDSYCIESLAALLREVGITRAAYRDQLLAEVRRVVEDVRRETATGVGMLNEMLAANKACNDIISRLEKL